MTEMFAMSGIKRCEIDDKLKQLQEKVLEPGEKILWAERPVPAFFSPETGIKLLAGIVWSFCLLAMMIFSRFKGADWMDVAPVLLFMPLGFLLMLAPLIRYRRMRRTIYAITKRRALAILHWRNPVVRSYSLEEIRQVRVHQRDNGIGDVRIICGVRVEGLDEEEENGFFNIRNPAEIACSLKSLAAAAGGPVAVTGLEREGNHCLAPAVVQDSPARNRTVKVVSGLLILLLVSGFFPMLQNVAGVADRLTGTGYPGLLLVVLLFLTLAQLRLIFQAGRSTNWPTTPGIVTDSYVLRNNEEGGTFYIPRIHYRYRVKGKEFFSTRITTGQDSESLDREAAAKIIARYPEGSRVTIYHHPRRPGYSALEPGRGVGNWIVLFLVLACLVAATLWLGVEQKWFSFSFLSSM
jgi:hypothetical protein